ncbi:cyclin-like protein [Nitzschia inconspicua]|uniref:Cyclin-like protein n=1 Tax=Nitzschia inconspicua TaxID=303405 RepID=A0A9K3KDI1_9STRA|nr:cyclin-like protein [Nitzschia inconspicua]
MNHHNKQHNLNHCHRGQGRQMMETTEQYHHQQLDASASSSATGALPLSQDMVIDRLRAMLYQESKGYEYETYFPDPSLHHQQQWNPLNQEWREKICQWTYNVVDTYDLPREIVALSLNYFDRFLATRGNQCNGTLALLVSLTTLHIAMKVHSSTGTFKLQKLAELSRGQFGPRHIEQMEWQIMSALKFKLHPPTLFAFISYYMMLFPQQQQQQQQQQQDIYHHPYEADVIPRHAVRKELFEVAIYMAELSVCDSFFVPYPTSLVALAALANVMDDMPPSKLPPSCKQGFWDLVSVNVGLELHPHYGRCHGRTKLLQEARDQLRHMFQTTTTSAGAAAASSGQPTASTQNGHANGNGHGNSSIHSTASLTSSPTSAAEMMAMEDWNDPVQHPNHHHTASSAMDCGRDDHRMMSVHHPDTEDEEEEEGASFRYSPSPPMSNSSEPLTQQHGFNYHHHHQQQHQGTIHHHAHQYHHPNQGRSSSAVSSSKHHQQQHQQQQQYQQKYRRTTNSSSPTSFLARSTSPASRARMACSPIVAGVQ